MPSRLWFLPLPLFFMLSACQQAAWKAGASADDFKRDEQACRMQTNDDEVATRECLRGKGWTIADFRADENEDTNNDTASEASAPPPSQPIPPTMAPLNSSVSQTKPAASNRENAPMTMSSAPSSADIGTATIKKSADPLQKQSVQTWWKAGAQAADFNNDANACLEKLGDQHTPDYARHLFTRAMVGCLRERGWYAGRDPVYTPLR